MKTIKNIKVPTGNGVLPHVSVSLYFDVDMPKIIRAAIAHFSSGNER